MLAFKSVQRELGSWRWRWEMGVGVGWGGVRDWTIVVLWIVPVSLCNRVR